MSARTHHKNAERLLTQKECIERPRGKQGAPIPCRCAPSPKGGRGYGMGTGMTDCNVEGVIQMFYFVNFC